MNDYLDVKAALNNISGCLYYLTLPETSLFAVEHRKLVRNRKHTLGNLISGLLVPSSGLWFVLISGFAL
jgi:hypothetical protein